MLNAPVYDQRCGVTLNPSGPPEVLVGLVYNGDWNMDGTVDDSDVEGIINNFTGTSGGGWQIPGPQGWMLGDMNNDGYVNDDDVAGIINNFGSTLYTSHVEGTPWPASSDH